MCRLMSCVALHCCQHLADAALLHPVCLQTLLHLLKLNLQLFGLVSSSIIRSADHTLQRSQAVVR